MSTELQVSGGAGGLEVEYADLASAAHLLQDAALALAETAAAAQRVLADPGLLASVVLDPVGFARVEAAVVAATLGPHGLLPVAGRLEEHSLGLRQAVLRYAAVDRLDHTVRQVRQWAEGVAAGFVLPALPLLALSPLGVSFGFWARGGEADAFLADHPGVAEEAAGALPGFLDVAMSVGLGTGSLALGVGVTMRTGRPALVDSLEEACGLLGALYPPGSAVVVGRGADASAPPPPRGVADLLTALSHRDDAAVGAAEGEIDVRRLTALSPDGLPRTSWVVDLPGTKDWQPDPRHRAGLNDLATNLTTMAGDPTARVDGVTRAMELAGVRPGEPVMLVGHSQGGLVAIRAAEQYAASGRFTVTHVVTAGSPIARMTIPASVSVLSLENRYDVVPRLDGEPAPPQPNRVTVVFDAQSHDVVANHDISTTYLPAAAHLDQDVADPSLAAWRQGASAFLSGDEVSTSVWDIRNGRG
jgi:pimeloyl-ACP methyl ester carboxylesterase